MLNDWYEYESMPRFESSIALIQFNVTLIQFEKMMKKRVDFRPVALKMSNWHHFFDANGVLGMAYQFWLRISLWILIAELAWQLNR